ncbi:hypothetical protein NKG94_15630 [Micromonospora sp. M12]
MLLTAPPRLLATLLASALATGTVAAVTHRRRSAPDRPAVIVVLADQHDAPTGRQLAERSARIAVDQQPMLTDLRRVGATRVKPFRMVNAIATTVPERALADLASRPGYGPCCPTPAAAAPTGRPDRCEPARCGDRRCRAGGRTCAGPGEPPLVEPEGLALTRTVGSARGRVPTTWPTGRGAGRRARRGDRPGGGRVRPGRAVGGGRLRRLHRRRSGRPSYILESFGDASVVAAQGVGVYDAGRYAHPVHRPPHRARCGSSAWRRRQQCTWPRSSARSQRPRRSCCRASSGRCSTSASTC